MRLHSILGILAALFAAQPLYAQTSEHVSFSSGAWEIHGELVVPETASPPPVAILLHTMWRGNRSQYDEFADVLSEHGVASLRMDLRGHGESVNMGELEYLTLDPDLIFDAWPDIVAAEKFLKNRTDVDADRLAVVAASYSGELAAKAGRNSNFADIYVILASGLLSPESLIRMEVAEVPLIFVYAKDDHTWAPQTAKFIEMRQSGEIWTYEDGGHATELLTSHPELNRRIAEKLKEALNVR